MPDHDDLDERIARLQRLAFGADSRDDERAAAASELAALRDGGASEPTPPRAHPVPAMRDGAPAALRDDSATRSARPETSARAAAPGPSPSRASLRTALPYATAALAGGLVLGWALGSATEPSEGADVGIPVEETTAWEVFDRPVTTGDFVRYPAPLVDIRADDTSRRLLLTRSDGVQLVAVRTADGEDACLVLAVPVGRPATACTDGGLFPSDGLTVEISVQGVGVYLAGWDPDGSARVNTAEAPTD